MLLSDEAQVQSGLIHWTVPSVKLPFAANPTADPGVSTAVGGVIVIEANVPVSTISCVDPVALAPAKLKLAAMFAVPVLTPTATPELGDTVPMVATAVLPEVQVTRELMLCV